LWFTPGRDEHRKACADRSANATENRLTRPFLHAKDLVEFVDFRPDLFLGFQRHDDELAVLRRVQNVADICVLAGDALYVFHEPIHNDISFVGCLVPKLLFA